MSRRKTSSQLDTMTILQSGRLNLRPPCLDDAEAIYTYASDPEVTRFLAWPTHNHLVDTQRFIQEATEGWQTGSHPVWLIEGEQGVLGAIGARISKVNAGVGYVLSREYWGQGFATEALVLVTESLFRRAGVEVVWALCITENIASQRVLEKAGYRYQKTCPEYFECPNLVGGKKDVLLYARDKPRAMKR